MNNGVLRRVNLSNSQLSIMIAITLLLPAVMLLATRFGFLQIKHALVMTISMYTIYTRDDLLKNENRRQIVAIITRKQGITYTSLKKELGLKDGVLAYHLATLEKRRFIKSARDGKFKRFYPMDARISGLSTIQEKIVDIIRIDPTITQVKIAKIIGAPPGTVNNNIKKLIKNRVLYARKNGRKITYIIVDPRILSSSLGENQFGSSS